MSDRSAIEWTETTWNPVTGCTKVSTGCDHCYAEVFAERFRGVPGHPYNQGFDLTLRPERLAQPAQWRRPRRVFVNSMSDLSAGVSGASSSAAVQVTARFLSLQRPRQVSCTSSSPTAVEGADSR